MKKNFLWGALALIAMASCSQDDVVSIQQDEIKFSAVANKATRAADVYCNNNLPASFKVYANHTVDGESSTYIEGDEITLSGTTWTNSTGKRFWPEEGSLDFYAHVNAGDNFTWTSGSVPSITGYTVDTDVTKQNDLMYAVKTEQTKEDNSTAGVILNFRHALSQIVFQAKNTNKNFFVEIEGVTIGNIISKANFTYPSADTDDNVEDHTQSATSSFADASQGVWEMSDEATDIKNYPVSFTNVEVPGDGEICSLTSTNGTDQEFSDNALLLIPEQNGAAGATIAWDPETNAKVAEATGTYFLIKCKIRNVAGDEVADDDVYLWGTASEAKELAIPVSLTWKQGVKYIYTFVFGEGIGGYDPEGEEVLVPITFSVTVDDFTSPTSNDIDMGSDE